MVPFVKLSELPSPPDGYAGWPWTEECPRLPACMPDGSTWPQISIVSPSFNQGPFIEHTIRTVLLQGYPNLEYIIMDAGSTDETLAILRKYDPWISEWVSEPDNGQANAINKGFQRSNGEILAWINTDDIYEKGAFYRVATAFRSLTIPDVVYGNARIIDEEGRYIARMHSVPFNARAYLYGTVHIAVQSAVFWKRDLFFKAGMLNENLQFAMDQDLYVRFLEMKAKFKFIKETLGAYRNHQDSKSIKNLERSIAESLSIRTIGEIRSRRDYPFWHLVYRLRQLGFLAVQGDLFYLTGRFLNRLFPQR